MQTRVSRYYLLPLTPDGRTLATTDSDKAVRLWDVPSGQERAVMHGHADTILAGMFSFDGNLLATGGNDNTVKIWNTATGKELTTLLPSRWCPVFSLAWSPNNKLLVAGYSDDIAQLWEVSSGCPQLALGEHGTRVRCLAFSPDGATVASTNNNTTINLWDVSAAYCGTSPPDQPTPVSSLSFSPDGEWLATSNNQDKGMLWHVATGNGQAIARKNSDQSAKFVAFSPTGRELAICSAETDVIYLVDPITGDQRLAIASSNEIRALIFSPDGGMLAGNFEDGAIRVWDARTGKGLHARKPTTIEPGAQSIAFSPDGKTLAIIIIEDLVQRLDLASGRIRELRTGHDSRIECLTYSPDGQTLATGSHERRIKLWDTGTDQETANQSGHQGVVTCLAFSPDGRTLASGGSYKELKLWDVATMQELFSLEEHTGTVNCAAFSPDGKTLATAGRTVDGQRGEIRFWRTATTEVKHSAVKIRPLGSAP